MTGMRRIVNVEVRGFMHGFGLSTDQLHVDGSSVLNS